MNTPVSVLSVLCFVSASVPAQEVPQPSPELQKYAPLIGNWHGTGTAQMAPGVESSWESHSTYSWALGGFYVQEDTVVTFADMPKPLRMRVYLGWDNEQQRHVAVGIDNDGTVAVNRVEFGPDGSMVQMSEKFHEGHTYAERYTAKIDGDRMDFAIDMMGAAGEPGRAASGTMKRSDKPVKMALDASAFTAAPAPAIVKLGKTAGTFAVKAKMVMMPGMPAMNITGQDEVSKLFDGTIVHVRTTGTAEGSPEQYEGHVFYGADPRSDGVRAVFVSNMGEVGMMSGSFVPGDESFVLTCAMQYMGQPCVQRMTMNFGPDGAPTKAVGHTILGTAPPYESWNATYTKK